jgi:hypothetical protein
MAKKERVDLIRKVYSKTEYPKIINTKFNELGVSSTPDDIAATFTVFDFFQKYNELFYDIPSYGATQSHEYLIKSSTDYIDFDQDNPLIEALQNEIANLRKDLLQAQIEKAEALTGEKINLGNVASLEPSNDLSDINQLAQESVDESRVVDPVSTSSPVSPSSNTSAGY